MDIQKKKSREPGLYRIVDDIGYAFGIGAIGGSVFHFIKGTSNSPKGRRFAGGTQAVTMNALRLGGSFAVFGGLFSAFDCTMVYMREKEDPWNSFKITYYYIKISRFCGKVVFDNFEQHQIKTQIRFLSIIFTRDNSKVY